MLDVRCGRATMTRDDVDKGRLICLISVAPVTPARFGILRILQKTRIAWPKAGQLYAILDLGLEHEIHSDPGAAVA